VRDIVYIDNAVAKTTMGEPLTAFRKTDIKTIFPDIEGTKAGDVRSVETYFSTSLSKQKAWEFETIDRDDQVVEVRVPAGQGIGIFVNGYTKNKRVQEEQELLLKRGSLYKLISYNPKAKPPESVAVIELVG